MFLLFHCPRSAEEIPAVSYNIGTSTKLLQNAARNNARRKKNIMNRRFCVYVPSFRILCFKNGSKLKTRGPMVL